MYVCMYVCMFVYIYIYIYIYCFKMVTGGIQLEAEVRFFSNKFSVQLPSPHELVGL